MLEILTGEMSRRQALSLFGISAVASLLPAYAVAGALPLASLSGNPAPDFALPNLDGETIRLSQFKGRVVIVNFWATWCPPCRFEIPSMQRAWEKTRDEGIVMLALHIGGDTDEVTNFSFDHGAEFPILMDTGSEVINRWPVRGLPTTVVVDPPGNMALRAIGGREWDAPAILAQIRALKA